MATSPTSPRYVKACINGARTPDEHPNLPVTPDELAAAALSVHRAGAQAVHLHPKTPEGKDSLEPDVVAAAVEAVRHAVPGFPLGVTTGFWALSDPRDRLRAVDAWDVLPDFASVNWHEPGSQDLARLLLSKGVGVEAGLFHADAVHAWAQSDLAAHCMRVMVELPPDADTAVADDLLAVVATAGSQAPVLLHGLDESAWPLVQHAGLRGVQTRIGFEDTLRLPDGTVADDNAALVTAALELLSR
jgi:uncharacterized protein (DUF849 family)